MSSLSCSSHSLLVVGVVRGGERGDALETANARPPFHRALRKIGPAASRTTPLDSPRDESRQRGRGPSRSLPSPSYPRRGTFARRTTRRDAEETLERVSRVGRTRAPDGSTRRVIALDAARTPAAEPILRKRGDVQVQLRADVARAGDARGVAEVAEGVHPQVRPTVRGVSRGVRGARARTRASSRAGSSLRNRAREGCSKR